MLVHLRPEEHHYKTVMTVMNRLVEKGLLRRTRLGRAFVYEAAQPRAAFMDNISRQVALGLVRVSEWDILPAQRIEVSKAKPGHAIANVFDDRGTAAGVGLWIEAWWVRTG